MKLFMDTWGFLVLADSKERFHRKAQEFYRDFRRKQGMAITSDYVLDETISRLFSKVSFYHAEKYITGILDSINAGYIKREKVTDERFGLAWDLRLKLDDKPEISFTDLTTIIIMKESGIRKIFSEDYHFMSVNMGLRRALFD